MYARRPTHPLQPPTITTQYKGPCCLHKALWRRKRHCQFKDYTKTTGDLMRMLSKTRHSRNSCQHTFFRDCYQSWNRLLNGCQLIKRICAAYSDDEMSSFCLFACRFHELILDLSIAARPEILSIAWQYFNTRAQSSTKRSEWGYIGTTTKMTHWSDFRYIMQRS